MHPPLTQGNSNGTAPFPNLHILFLTVLLWILSSFIFLECRHFSDPNPLLFPLTCFILNTWFISIATKNNTQNLSLWSHSLFLFSASYCSIFFKWKTHLELITISSLFLHLSVAPHPSVTQIPNKTDLFQCLHSLNWMLTNSPIPFQAFQILQLHFLSPICGYG